MKIHRIDDFDSYETTECNKTDIIELDGVRLIPITEVESIKERILDAKQKYESVVGKCGYTAGLTKSVEIVDDVLVQNTEEKKK